MHVDYHYSVNKIEIMTLKIFLLLFIYNVQAQVPFMGPCPDVESMKGFQVNKYLGKWYEQERYFAVFELSAKCVTAEYSQNSDGTVAVHNKQLNSVSGAKSGIMGVAKIVGDPHDGKLSVRFPSLPVQFDAPYWILDTDYDNYAIVWSCLDLGVLNTRNAWILTRARNPTSNIMDKAYKFLDSMDIDRTLLLKTDQQNCVSNSK